MYRPVSDPPACLGHTGLSRTQPHAWGTNAGLTLPVTLRA